MIARGMAQAALRLYPRRWQRRYREEIHDLLSARPVGARTLADLLAGAALHAVEVHRRGGPPIADAGRAADDAEFGIVDHEGRESASVH
jgi:hypothetical protein